MKSLPKNLVVIHLSSTAVHTVVACQSPCKKRAEIMAVGIAETTSFLHGEIINRDRLITAIKKSIRNAEEMANLRIESAVVCFGTPKMYSGNSVGDIAIDDVVDYDDMAAVLADAKARFVPNDHYVVSFMSQAYWINDDNQSCKKEVVGLTGIHKLRANYHLMTLPLSNLNHLYSVLDACGVSTDGVVFDVLAGAHYALIDEERRKGTLFVDIGAKSTSFCVYAEDTLIYSECIGVGGDFITEMIASRLNIDHREAERLKRYHATATINEGDKQQFIEINENNQSVINRALLSQAVQAGIEEIFGRIDRNLAEKQISASFATAGIVLAGEGSQVKNIVNYLKKRYYNDKLPVHLVNDETSRVSISINKNLNDVALNELSVLLKERRLRTALGAVLYCFDEELRREYQQHLGNKENMPNTLWDKILFHFKQITAGKD